MQLEHKHPVERISYTIEADQRLAGCLSTFMAVETSLIRRPMKSELGRSYARWWGTWTERGGCFV